MLETAFLLPWVLFLFVGSFDLGFYNYALISTQNAAPAAWYTSQSPTTAADATTACTYALAELSAMPNVGSTVTTCAASPVVVTASQVTGTDRQPGQPGQRLLHQPAVDTDSGRIDRKIYI